MLTLSIDRASMRERIQPMGGIDPLDPSRKYATG